VPGAPVPGELESSIPDAGAAGPSLPERRPSGNKAQPLKGDFNPKELAAGIRTVLNKEK
jgi:hypothetical protein